MNNQINSTIIFEGEAGYSEPTNDLIIATDRHPVDVYLDTLTGKKSRETMLFSLNAIAGVLMNEYPTDKRTKKPLPKFDARAIPSHLWVQFLTANTANRIRNGLDEYYEPRTTNRHLCALRGIADACFELGLLSGDECMRVKKVKSIQSHKEKAGRALEVSEVDVLFRQLAETDSNPTLAIRDAAIMSVFLVGLRVSEVITLDLADYNRTTGELLIHGKGRKERVMWLSNRVAMEEWLAIRGDGKGPLFYPVNKGGNIERILQDDSPAYKRGDDKAPKAGDPRRLTRQALTLMLERRKGDLADFTPHDMRRTFITNQLNMGTLPQTVQRMAGHKNIQTTLDYDRSGYEDMKRAANKVANPYAGRIHKPLEGDNG